MFKINLSYFPSRARLNFWWIFREFDLKSNMKGFFENFLALSVKKVLMILPSISGRERAFPAESCCYTPCLAISNFYRRWTPKLENLTLADWASWYDNCSSKAHVKETQIDIDGLPLQKYIIT